MTRSIRPTVLALIGIVVAALPRPAAANNAGITRFSGKQGPICSSCHGGGLPPEVRFIGPTMVAPGEMVTYRFEVQSASPGQTRAGFNVAVSDGQLDTLPDQGERRANNELTHTAPKANVDGIAGWDFVWTVPTAPGTYTLFGAGNSVNFNGQQTGDAPAATTLEVTVAEASPTPTATPPLPTATVTPSRGPVPCVGDCNASGNVTVNELILGVNIASGNAAIDACRDFDVNDSGGVEINELIAGVNAALSVCTP